MLVFSLTSIPPRFGLIDTTLRCLLAQNSPADRILLFIPMTYRRFPDWDGTLPKVPEGVEIIRCDEDYGPATKSLPAARMFAGQDVDILFCDDDRIYPPDWADVFLQARKVQPDAAIAPVAHEAIEDFPSTQERSHHPRAVQRLWQTDLVFLARYAIYLLKDKIWGDAEKPSRLVYKTPGYSDIFMGLGGVLIRPEHIPEIAYDIPENHWMVDDIWVSGMLAVNNVPIWTPANVLQPNLSPAHFQASLVRSVISGMNRKAADRACYDYLRETYGIWP